MNQVQIAVGDPVRITAGTYKDAEGVVEDLQPACDAVRVHTKSGVAYGFLEAVVPLPLPKPRRSPIRK